MKENINLQSEDKPGCSCAGCSEECSEAPPNPWPRGTAYVTTALFGIPVSMGAYALLRKAPRRLPIFVSIWAALATAVRQVVCCRCEYYGQECSTLMGLWTASRFERDEDNPLTAEAFQLDFALIGASMLYPLPQVARMGQRYLAFYALSIAVGGAGMRLLACRVCPNDVCFMNPNHQLAR